MNKKVKAAFYFCIAICLLLSLGGPASAEPGDVQGHWAEGTINEWLDKGMVSGFPDGSFKPNQPVTRAEFIIMVNKAFEFTGTAEVAFSDVSSTDWFYNEVAKAVKEGYITGYEDGTFKPNNPISRQEAAAILCRVLKIKPEVKPAILSLLVDSESISDWAKASVSAAVENHIMAGYQDFTFGPGNAITRAEALVAINNALKTEPITLKQEPAVAAPPGGGGGGGGDTTNPTVVSASITVKKSGGTEISVAATIETVNGIVTGTIDLTGAELNDTAKIISGKMKVSEASTLTRLTPELSGYEKIKKFKSSSLEQNLTILEALNTAGVTIGTLKTAFGSTLTFTGTLKDNSNNTSNVSLIIKLPV